jgi:hypothetical protein
LDDFFRFSAEEILRRQAKRDALPLTKAQILSLLYGSNISDFRENLKHRRIKERQDAKNAVGNDPYG